MNYICEICTTKYCSYKSLWNHNKKFHSELNIRISDVTKKGTHECPFCKKKFTRKNNMVYHINKTCKGDIYESNNDNNNDIKKELNILKKELESLKNSIKSNVTNNKIDNSLINTGTINNNLIYINQIGTENLLTLTKKDINEIFNKSIDGINTFIKKINFNENLPANHSFCTTNLEGPYLSVYDSTKSKITKDRKKYFFERLFRKSVDKMKELYEINKKTFNKNKQQQIEDTLKTLVELQNMDMNTRIYKEMTKQLNMLSYNERKIVQETWRNNKIGKYTSNVLENVAGEKSSDSDDNSSVKSSSSNSDDGSDVESSSDSDDSSSSECKNLIIKRKKKNFIV